MLCVYVCVCVCVCVCMWCCCLWVWMALRLWPLQEMRVIIAHFLVGFCLMWGFYFDLTSTHNLSYVPSIEVVIIHKITRTLYLWDIWSFQIYSGKSFSFLLHTSHISYALNSIARSSCLVYVTFENKNHDLHGQGFLFLFSLSFKKPGWHWINDQTSLA